MTVQIGRSDGELKTFRYIEGETVEELAERAGLTVASNDEVTDEMGDAVSVSDDVQDGNEYYIATNYKNGLY